MTGAPEESAERTLIRTGRKYDADQVPFVQQSGGRCASGKEATDALQRDVAASVSSSLGTS